MTEDELLRAVLDLLRVYQFRTFHARPAWTAHGMRTAVQGDGKGFPDILAVGRGRILAIELKSELGQPTLDQRAWLATFRENGAEAYLWRPGDLPGIPGILSGRFAPRAPAELPHIARPMLTLRKP
jgi:hypothetical protein